MKNDESSKRRDDAAAGGKRDGRKPYRAPAWEVEETEAEAEITCAKADDANCGAGPIQS